MSGSITLHNPLCNKSGLNTHLSFLPLGPLSALKNRINVTEVPHQKIREVMKTAEVFEQEVILQDLLIAGRKKITEAEREFQVLAAELFIKASDPVRYDFLMHLKTEPYLFKDFLSALKTNFTFRATTLRERPPLPTIIKYLNH